MTHMVVCDDDFISLDQHLTIIAFNWVWVLEKGSRVLFLCVICHYIDNVVLVSSP